MERNGKYLRELTLFDDSQHLIKCVLWEDVALESPSDLKEDSFITIKGARISWNKFHGVSINVNNGATVKYDDFEKEECQNLKQWHNVNGYKVVNDLWQNKLLVFEQEDCVDINDMVNRVYDSHDAYIKNLRASIISLTKITEYVCSNRNCKNIKLKLNNKSRYVCNNCDPVKPKEAHIVRVVIGNTKRSLKVYCYDDLAIRLAKEYVKWQNEYLFRISGILQNVKVN